MRISLRIETKKEKRISIIVVAIFMILLIGCGIYINDYYQADEAAQVAMESELVQQSENYITFHAENSKKGFIFYPGGKVEAEAYAPLMQALSKEGIFCILMEMPFNLAVLDIDAADGIQETFPNIQQWYIGGHSLGGSMAASYAAEHSEDFEGLVLLASYSTADLKESGLDVISIFGSEDHVLNRMKYEEYTSNLPLDYQEFVIQGGCHAYFGSYGPQEGDGTPTISSEAQIETTVLLLSEYIF